MIRTATQKDIDSVLTIERLSFKIPWSLISFRKALQKIFLVEDKVAGYLIAECRQRNCYMATINRLAVHPEQRGAGIGTKLLDTGLKIMMNREIELVMLNVETSRKAAVRLYTEFGFRITYASFYNASIAFAMDSKASTFYTMELQMKQKNTFSPHLPLNENQKKT